MKLAEEALITGNVETKCLTFVDINGQVTCDIDKITSLIKSADPRLVFLGKKVLKIFFRIY